MSPISEEEEGGTSSTEMTSPKINYGQEGYQSTYWQGQSQNIETASVREGGGNDDEDEEAISSMDEVLIDLNKNKVQECQISDEILDRKNIINISVGNAEKHGEGFKDAFVTYEVKTKFFADYSQFVVRRRYQDFLWLLNKFKEDLATGVIAPPLPDKNRLDYMDRFSPEFIKKRYIGLERFLKRLSLHPNFSNHPALKSFLTQPILGVDETLMKNLEKANFDESNSSSRVATVVEHVSDAVINAFTKRKPIEEKYLVMKKVASIEKVNFEKISTLHGKHVNAYKGLSEALISSGTAMDRLSSLFGRLETIVDGFVSDSREQQQQKKPMRSILGDYSQLMQEEGTLVATMAEEMDIKVSLLASELSGYSHNAKKALKLRDSKQQEWQDLQDHLNSCREELRILSGQDNTSTTSNTATSNTGITESGASDKIWSRKTVMVNYLAERLDSIRGIDPVTSRTERIRKLEQRITELEDTKKISQSFSTKVDSNISKEFQIFMAILDWEVKESYVSNMANIWINYYQSELGLLETFVKDSFAVGLVNK